MRDLVNRRSEGYHVEALETMKPIDKIASTLLAISYSNRQLTPASQNLIQYDCVAACFVADNELWVASNSKRISQGDILELYNYFSEDGIAIDDIDIYVVENGDGDMHAEMQLLAELIAERADVDNLYFGVSKPCCMLCKEMLEEYGIDYTDYHGDAVANWQNPENYELLNYSPDNDPDYIPN